MKFVCPTKLIIQTHTKSDLKPNLKSSLAGWFTCLMLTANAALAASFQLEASNNEPLYQTSLPKAVYALSRSNTLQDLTIHNASGEQVPYALLLYAELYPQASTKVETKPLFVFPIDDASLNNPNALRIQLEKTNTKTTVNISANNTNDANVLSNAIYLVDAGEKHPALQNLNVQWHGAEGKFIPLEILSSHNLKNWSHIGNAVLLKTAQAGNTILNNTITLDNSTDARYLQIRLNEPSKTPAFKLTAVNAEYHSQQAVTLPFLWQDVPFSTRVQDNKTGLINVAYEALGRYPASRLQIKLPQTNTITNVTVLVRNKTNEPWVYLSNASLYRITQQGKTITNPDIMLNPTVARYWQLQFNQASGSIGAENPTLSIGWLPETVVWNARGTAPFTLHVGENPNIINTVSIASLIPGYQTKQGYEIEKIKQLPVAKVIGFNDENSSSTSISNSAWASPADYKSWLLWTGLLLGVLLLAGMAYSLLKRSRKE